MKVKSLNGYFLVLMSTVLFSSVLTLFQLPVFGDFYISPTFIGQLVYLSTVFAFCYVKDMKCTSFITFKKVKPFNLIAAILSGGIVTTISILTVILYRNLDITFPSVISTNYNNSFNITTLIAGVLLAPVIEEIIFRGLLYNLFAKYRGPLVGVVMSTIYFVILHFRLSNLLTAIIMGIVSALFYEATQSLIPCIIIHGMNNASTLWVSKWNLASINLPTPLIILLILLLIGMLLLCCNKVMHVNTNKNLYELAQTKQPEDKSQRVIDPYFIFTVVVWVLVTLF